MSYLKVNTTTALSGVVILVFFNWAFLVYMFSWNLPQHDNSLPESLSELNSSRNQRSHNLPTDDEKLEFEGVAATLMLNNPKWFQRRYTMMVQNALLNTPSNWAVQIFYTGTGQSQFGLDISPGLTRLIESNPRVILTKLPPDEVKKNKKNKQMWTTEWIWDSMVSSRVLVFSGNGAICSNSKRSIAEFSDLDYIGIPWGRNGGLGGDGSTYSVRNQAAMLAAIRYQKNKGSPHDGNERDDIFFARTLKEMNDGGVGKFNIATKNQTEEFGGLAQFNGDFADEKHKKAAEELGPPTVVSGTIPQFSHPARELMLDLCPELKLIFPSLHNPACFGAHPKSDKCAESICALRKDPKKGGC